MEAKSCSGVASAVYSVATERRARRSQSHVAACGSTARLEVSRIRVMSWKWPLTCSWKVTVGPCWPPPTVSGTEPVSGLSALRLSAAEAGAGTPPARQTAAAARRMARRTPGRLGHERARPGDAAGAHSVHAATAHVDGVAAVAARAHRGDSPPAPMHAALEGQAVA